MTNVCFFYPWQVTFVSIIHGAIIFGVLHLFILVLNVRSMLGLMKFLLSHISSFFGEQRIQQGIAGILFGHESILQGLPQHLQGTPQSFFGVVRIPFGLTRIPAGQPHCPEGYPQHKVFTPHHLSGSPCMAKDFLMTIREQTIVCKGVPSVHTVIP